MSDTNSTTTKLGLRPVEVAVGAGAAVITAFATSFLGAAGTLVGAALASIVATVSSSLLRSSAARTNESLRRTNAWLRQQRLLPPDAAGPIFGTAADAGHLGPSDPAGSTLPGGPPDLAAPTEPAAVGAAVTGGPPYARTVRSRRPRWLALAAGAAAAFVAAMLLITGVESAIGKPLAGLFGKEHGGRSTIGVPVRNDQPDRNSDQPSGGTGSRSPTPTDTPGTPTEPSSSVSGTGAPASSPAPESSQPAPSSPAPSAPAPTPSASP